MTGVSTSVSCPAFRVWGGILLMLLATAASASDGGDGEIRVVLTQGVVEVLPPGSTDWVITSTNQILKAGYLLRTGDNSRAGLEMSDKSVVPIGAHSEVEILPRHEQRESFGLNLIRGLLSFFHRDEPGRIQIRTRGAAAGVEGTEFVLEVTSENDKESTRLSVIDGTVLFSNVVGSILVTNGQQAVADAGTRPRFTAGFITNNIVQWALYYPAVLDLQDLPLTPNEPQMLHGSLQAYASGDLLAALAAYPAGRSPVSDAERIYYSTLLLSVGQVSKAERMLENMSGGSATERLPRLANALKTLIAAVKLQPRPTAAEPQLPTEFLAASYYEQSLATGDKALEAALKMAREAAGRSSDFGFAHARVAELELCFGRREQTKQALLWARTFTPRNAHALTIEGFVLASENMPRQAIDHFDRALAIDSALGNAWLGRGLSRIRVGDAQGGREDLLVAAAVEPQRALLRSYLAKAFADSGDEAKARHELRLAEGLDPNDPTAWLYAALINQQNNRFNEGIRDLEKSQELNDNRRLYRSRLLLDQDHAVRSSSLANLYRDAGMEEVSVREAARAVSYDYANYAAHLFLAESYNTLRDPTRFNLRQETPWFNELLLANLLSPVGGTTLSQNPSQQEYSRLFERNRIGFNSFTDYRTDGQIRQLASHYGNLGNSGWALDLDYQHNDGVRPNNELDRLEWYATFKQQLTPQDSILLLAKYQDYHSGDNFQYYNPDATTNAWNTTMPVIRTNYNFDEYQHPIAVAGYHHEWAPGIHTLLLGGRLENDQRFSDTQAGSPLLQKETNGAVTAVNSLPMDVTLQSQFEIYTSELNQIFKGGHQQLVLGGRFQTGEFESTDNLKLSSIPLVNTDYLPTPVSSDIREAFDRISAYGYYTLEVSGDLLLTAGLAYDQLHFPSNFRQPPIAPGTEHREQLSPKAALVWSPIPEITVRGIYSRALGGVSFDESFRLEPTQLAGFSQSFRTIIPESVVGSVSAPTFEIAGLALDTKFKTGTYFGVQAEILKSDVERELGVFNWDGNPPPPPIRPAVTQQELQYEEHSIEVSINQLVSDTWSFGAHYRYTESELHSVYPAIPVSVNRNANTREKSELHQVGLFALFNHPYGIFARGEAMWYHQRNSNYPTSDFIQGNVFLGWRSRRQRAEVSIGVLNLADTDYHLNPLTPYSELPRERVFVARLRINL